MEGLKNYREKATGSKIKRAAVLPLEEALLSALVRLKGAPEGGEDMTRELEDPWVSQRVKSVF